MDYSQHLGAVEREIGGILTALAAGPIDAPVPTCPDWTVSDLMAHVGEFTVFWAHVLCEGTGRPKPPATEMPAGDAIHDWYAGLGAAFVEALRATDPGQSVWTWVEDQQNAAFVARRCAHELAVHRFDLESARGATRPIEAELAADGIEEIFVMIGARRAENEHAGRGLGESLAVSPTDRPDRWRIELTPGGLSVERPGSGADLELSGATSDLELLLYRRPTRSPVTRTGDPAALDAWYRAFHFD